MTAAFGPIDAETHSRVRTKAARRQLKFQQDREAAEERRAEAILTDQGYEGDLDPANQQEPTEETLAALAQREVKPPFKVGYILLYTELGRVYREPYPTEQAGRAAWERVLANPEVSESNLYRQEGLGINDYHKLSRVPAASPATAPVS